MQDERTNHRLITGRQPEDSRAEMARCYYVERFGSGITGARREKARGSEFGDFETFRPLPTCQAITNGRTMHDLAGGFCGKLLRRLRRQ